MLQPWQQVSARLAGVSLQRPRLKSTPAGQTRNKTLQLEQVSHDLAAAHFKEPRNLPTGRDRPVHQPNYRHLRRPEGVGIAHLDGSP